MLVERPLCGVCGLGQAGGDHARAAKVDCETQPDLARVQIKRGNKGDRVIGLRLKARPSA